jgi:hypothetical protein
VVGRRSAGCGAGAAKSKVPRFAKAANRPLEEMWRTA